MDFDDIRMTITAMARFLWMFVSYLVLPAIFGVIGYFMDSPDRVILWMIFGLIYTYICRRHIQDLP